MPGPSGSAAIIVDSAAENTIVVAPGANAHLTVDRADVRAVVADCDIVLMQLEIPIATAVAAAEIARAAGAVVMVNASPAGAKPHDLLALSELADVVVVNEAEAREWHWPVPQSGDHPRLAGRQLPRRGRAVRRARACGAPGRHHRRGRRLRGRVGGGLARTATSDALRRACAAGALSTLVPGAGDCAPYAEAIEDAVVNRKAGERQL